MSEKIDLIAQHIAFAQDTDIHSSKDKDKNSREQHKKTRINPDYTDKVSKAGSASPGAYGRGGREQNNLCSGIPDFRRNFFGNLESSIGFHIITGNQLF